MSKKIIFIISLVIVVVAGFGLFTILNNKSVKKADDKPVKDREVSQKMGSARQLFDLAKTQETNNELVLAEGTYRNILNNYPDYLQIQDVQKRMEDLNMKIIFSPALITPDSRYYEVKPGDSLIKIAHRFNTTVDLIMRINLLKSELIRPRTKLKIWTGKFSVLVDKSQNVLLLKSEETIIRTYTVSTGKDNSTPVGTFKIDNKLVDPPWKGIPADDPRNILGTRWMGFNLTGYGIHGTTQPQDLGQQITDGCIRMRNEDVEELFSLLPLGTEVTVID